MFTGISSDLVDYIFVLINIVKANIIPIFTVFTIGLIPPLLIISPLAIDKLHIPRSDLLLKELSIS